MQESQALPRLSSRISLRTAELLCRPTKGPAVAPEARAEAAEVLETDRKAGREGRAKVAEDARSNN